MTEIFNKSEETQKRRQLRAVVPATEKRVWELLKNKQILGYKFRRQYGVGPYVIDFYCPALKLAIEIDGSSHDGTDAQEYDMARDTYIAALGISFLRIQNETVNTAISAVNQELVKTVIARQSSSQTSPLLTKEESGEVRTSEITSQSQKEQLGQPSPLLTKEGLGEVNNISVIGAARSGMDAARILAHLGANVLLSDTQTGEKLGAERLAQIQTLGVPFALNATVEQALPPNTELVVTSPGVPQHAPVLQAAVARNIPVWSEIELAYRLANAPMLAITGTNGKTTTTILLGAILQAAGYNALIAGNVSADEIKRTLVSAAWETRRPEAVTGRQGDKGKRRQGEEENQQEAELDLALYPTSYSQPSSYLVAEISSFQLEWVETFAPHVAILTNITPDHLNRHTSFEDYAQTKARIFAAQTGEDWAVLNYDNPASRAIGERDLPGRRVWFTRRNTPPDNGPCAWVDASAMLNVRLGSGCPVAMLRADELPPSLPGAHSIENVLAASVAALAVGITPEVIACAVKSFPGVAHRMEWVADIENVRYVNNSMCTNVAAAISSLRAMNRPTVVIMGGADKQLEYAPLVPALHDKARHVVLIGQVADKMEASFRAGGYARISRASTLEEATRMARQIATSGEAVLLLPACASFDMFTDFEARGVAFRNAVHALQSVSSLAAENTR